MKIYGDPRKREMARAYRRAIRPDDTYRRPFAWTVGWRTGRPDLKSHDWVIHRYREALAVEQNNRAAFTLITEI